MQHNRKEEWIDYIESLILRMTRLRERQAKERDALWVEIEDAVGRANDEGVSLQSIADRLDTSKVTVHRWLHKKRQDGWE